MKNTIQIYVFYFEECIYFSYYALYFNVFYYYGTDFK